LSTGLLPVRSHDYTVPRSNKSELPGPMPDSVLPCASRRRKRKDHKRRRLRCCYAL